MTQNRTSATRKSLTIPVNSIQLTEEEWLQLDVSIPAHFDANEDAPALCFRMPDTIKPKLNDFSSFRGTFPVVFQQLQPVKGGYLVTLKKDDDNQIIQEMMTAQEYWNISEVSKASILGKLAMNIQFSDDMEVKYEEAFWRLKELSSTELKRISIPYAINVEEFQLINDEEPYVNLNVWPTPLRVAEATMTGITTATTYIGSWLSCFAAHVEGAALWSSNFQATNPLKVWYVAAVSDYNRVTKSIEKFFKPHFGIKVAKCPGFSTHKSFILDPVALPKGLKFYRIEQRANCLVVLRSLAYHQGLNMGGMLNAAANHTGPDWKFASVPYCAWDEDKTKLGLCEARMHQSHPEFYPSLMTRNSKTLATFQGGVQFNAPKSSIDVKSWDTQSPYRAYCTGCRKPLKDSYALSTHSTVCRGIKTKKGWSKVAIDRPRFPCPEAGCSSTQVSAYLLETHIVQKHTYPKSFKCFYCPDAFDYRSVQQRHMDLVHRIIEQEEEDEQAGEDITS